MAKYDVTKASQTVAVAGRRLVWDYVLVDPAGTDNSRHAEFECVVGDGTDLSCLVACLAEVAAGVNHSTTQPNVNSTAAQAVMGTPPYYRG